MKIGIFDPYLDDLGGGEKYMVKIALCLAENHDVTIFWDNRKDLEELSERFNLDLSKIMLEDAFFSSETSFFGRLKRSKNYDILILLSDGSIPFLLSKKVFLHIQQPLPDRKDIKTKLKLLRISGIFCNSFYTKSYIDKSYGIDSKVLYPPVELKPRNIKKENIILHVGRFRVKDVVTKRKNRIEGIGDYKKQNIMIGAFKRMIDSGLKNWKFVLAVSLKEEDRSKFNALKKKTEGYPIEFLINKNNNELWEMYSKSKIYWHASGFGEDLGRFPEYAEHFGISTVEAMGAGAVPIVINAGGQREIVEDGASGFLWNTIDDLIKKTEKVTEDEKLRTVLGQKAKKRAGFFTGDRFCKELNDILGL